MLKSSGLVLMAYVLFILQLVRLIWLKGYSQSLLIDFQELTLLTKFTFLFFLGQETYSLVWLSRNKKYYSYSTIKRLLIVGFLILAFFMTLIGYKYSINYSKYTIYLLAILLWTTTRNTLRLKELHIEIYFVDILIALIIWILIFFTKKIDLSLNLAGILLFIISLSFLYKYLNKEKYELELVTSSGLLLIIASSFTNILQQGLLLISKDRFSIEEWSDLSYELSIVNGLWMAVGVIIWKIQTHLWGQSRNSIKNSQKSFVVASLLFSLCAIGAIFLTDAYTSYSFNKRIYLMVLIFLPINSITPIQSYLISREMYWRIILTIVVSLLIIFVLNNLITNIVLVFLIGSVLYSGGILLAWNLDETE